MKPKRSVIGYLVLINIMHLAACFGVYLLRRYGLFALPVVKGASFAVTVFLWFVFSAVAAAGMNVTRRGFAVWVPLMAVLPITAVGGVCAALAYFADNASFGWLKFFFLGSAVNFWFRPFTVLVFFAEKLGNNPYILYGLIVLGLCFVSFVGASFGIASNMKKVRRRRLRRARKQKEKMAGSPETVASLASGDADEEQDSVEDFMPDASDEEIIESAEDDIEDEHVSESTESDAEIDNGPEINEDDELSLDEDTDTERSDEEIDESKVYQSGDEFVSIIEDSEEDEKQPLSRKAPVRNRKGRIQVERWGSPFKDDSDETEDDGGGKFRITYSDDDDNVTRFIEISKKDDKEGEGESSDD